MNEVPAPAAEARRALASHLRAIGAIRRQLIYNAFAAVSRHAFVPVAYQVRGGRLVPHRFTGADPDELALVYRDRTLVTGVDSVGCEPGACLVVPLAHGGIDMLVRIDVGADVATVRPIGGAGYFINAQGPLYPAALSRVPGPSTVPRYMCPSRWWTTAAGITTCGSPRPCGTLA